MSRNRTIRRGVVRATVVVLAALVALAAGLAIPGFVQGADLSAPATAQKPFSAVYVTSFVEHDGAYWSFSGPGTGTIVGPSTVVCWVHQPWASKARGTGTITTDTGDSLYFDFTQTLDKDTRAYVGPYTIVGGTGRFGNASGTGTFIATDNPDRTVTLTFDGTISF